jgi:hypothetical protein
VPSFSVQMGLGVWAGLIFFVGTVTVATSRMSNGPPSVFLARC